MYSLSKEQSMLSRKTVQNAFYGGGNCAPFSTETFYPLSRETIQNAFLAPLALGQ